MRLSRITLFVMLTFASLAPAAFAQDRPKKMPDASAFSMLIVSGAFLAGAIKRKFGR